MQQGAWKAQWADSRISLGHTVTGRKLGANSPLCFGGIPGSPSELSPAFLKLEMPPIYVFAKHPELLRWQGYQSVKHYNIYSSRQTQTDRRPPGKAWRYPLGLMFGALQVRVVLLYRVQGDVADVARVAALQACKENPESLILHCPQHRLCISV